ncbi:MAG: alpha/beta hydrolase [Alphaproteobacteria bacterium]
MFVDVGPSPAPTLLFAHGAGAPMDSGFMDARAAALAARGRRTLRFEFPYMAGRRAEGRKRPPDRMPVLEMCFREAFAAARAVTGAEPLFVGGKSMGARVASHLADELGAAGLICLGYPFHPPGKPERLRTDHLAGLAMPALIVQGERDPFGRADEVARYRLAAAIRIAWAPDGDHDLKPRKASGRSHADNIAFAADAVAAFMSASG